ncbi:AraC family transcriptional regulator [Alcanivorax sp. 1008]|uniref:AraC family transcriptional regulator n=1 Tax=Alcanivorax sp. 1008 TaxID=2816853 RepID=UPI001DA0879C|nr:AraC family transcriptional regulator [Alcanivorax sp. 1008]MCC1495953.1 AraC family transcriptional regulator [Alcanivorax sp. 1008]
MKDPYRAKQPSISIAYLQLLLEILAERGISDATLLQGVPLDPALLDNSQARMSPTQWTLLVMRAQALSADPALGYEYGLRMRPTVHGVLGYAAMSAATLRQAQEISVRYARLRQAGFTFEFVEDDQYGNLILRERQPIPVMRQFFVENILLGIARATAVLLGRDLLDIPGMEICFDNAEPDYHKEWQHRLPTTHFQQPVNMLRLPQGYLCQRPVMADPLASRGAIELCEKELALAADQEADITQRVRAELVLTGDGYPRLEQVAEKLCISTRTLKRKLQRHGTSFLLIVEECRRRDAQNLFEHSGLSVQAVATKLGYQNPANFSRAFRKWTGESPTSFRHRLRNVIKTM